MRLRVAGLVILFSLLPALVSAFQQVEFRMEFGQQGSGPGQMREPSDVAVDAEGRVYVADKGNRRIHVLSRDGKTLSTWGSREGDSWSLKEPSGITFYEDRVYVTDSSLNKVLVFSKEGKFIDEFGGSGSDPKQFDGPRGICVHQGIIYVADTGNHRIQSFSLDGIYLGSIGVKGSEAGEVRSPSDVAVDHKGYIYVADTGNNRVEVFTPSGRHHRNYYDIEEPSSIVIDNNGFFVAEAGNYKIKKFDFDGRLLLSFGTKGDAQAQFTEISGISLDGESRVFVSDSGKNTIQIFSPEKTASMPQEDSSPPDSVKLIRYIDANTDVEDVAWDRDTLYATSSKEDAVLVIQQGIVRRFIRGDGKNGFSDPGGIAIDPQGFLWVVDSGNNRIVKLNRDGTIVSAVGGSGSKEGHFSSPRGIAISANGLVYVADTGNERVQVFNTSGVFMSKIEKFGATIDKEDFDRPADVGLDAMGNIFVVDEGANRVVKLDNQGGLLLSIGREGEGNGEFRRPNGILVTREEIFILDSGNRRVQVFDHKGRFLRKFGAIGKGRGDFSEPSGIAMKDEITIFVSDKGNKRIQELGLIYTPQFPLQLKAEGGVRMITLSWPKNLEPYFSHYRIYRSEDKVNYKFLGVSQEPPFVDKDVKPSVAYFYRVSTVAKEGNESAKSSAAEGKAKKFVPSPPSDVRATPGENEILLSWQSASGEDVILYIIYRETDGSFKEAGRVKTTIFTDRGLKPNTAYSYKITALSSDNEESKAAPVKATTILKKAPSPPLDVKAAPGENEIQLSWQPVSGEDVALYIIYRETDGAFKETGRAKATTFTDKGLKPNTTYSYKITALSPDNREGQAAFINATTILKKPPIDVTVLKMSDIFSRAYKIYEKDGVGKIRITNNTAKPLTDVRVSFMTSEFMENPAVAEIREIRPWEGADVDLKPSFSNKIFSLAENRSIQAEIKIVYSHGGEVKSYSMSHTLIAIPTGRRFSDADVKRFMKAIEALNQKALDKKAEKDVIKKIKESFDATDTVINKLKARNLSYGEIIVCVYLSNQTGKSMDDILNVRTAGQSWPEIMSIYDVGITDITYMLNQIEKEIGIKEKPKPRERHRESEKFYQ